MHFSHSLIVVEIAGKEGINAVIQPGGSIKDDLSIEYCNKNQIGMVFTGIRHFKHIKFTIMGLFNVFTQEVAIDLGTANTLIINNDKVIVDEPSIVAMDRTTGKVIAIGRKAQQMHGKTHENIKTIRPLKDGVIADFLLQNI